jgi:hypothetical protein
MQIRNLIYVAPTGLEYSYYARVPRLTPWAINMSPLTGLMEHHILSCRSSR